VPDRISKRARALVVYAPQLVLRLTQPPCDALSRIEVDALCPFSGTLIPAPFANPFATKSRSYALENIQVDTATPCMTQIIHDLVVTIIPAIAVIISAIVSRRPPKRRRRH
jgi:hypothetical protein